VTAGSGQPSPDKDWMTLDEACRLVSRDRIARWCRDGVLRSRAGLRVTQILDGETGAIYPDSEQDFLLDPTVWATEKLRDTLGPHWQGGEISFESEGLPYVLDLVIVGGTLYRLQVHRGDFDLLLATAPKKRGRPAGGGYLRSDKAIIEEMRVAMANGDFTSPTAAAEHFAETAKGGGTRESKAKRLVSRYMASE
jgi:hypothetical protein